MQTKIQNSGIATQVVDILKEFGITATTAPHTDDRGINHTLVIVNAKDDVAAQILFPLRKWTP